MDESFWPFFFFRDISILPVIVQAEVNFPTNRPGPSQKAMRTVRTNVLEFKLRPLSFRPCYRRTGTLPHHSPSPRGGLGQAGGGGCLSIPDNQCTHSDTEPVPSSLPDSVRSRRDNMDIGRASRPETLLPRSTPDLRRRPWSL